jgi:hypothetical protein
MVPEGVGIHIWRNNYIITHVLLCLIYIHFVSEWGCKSSHKRINRQNTIKINKRVNVPNWHYTVYSNSLYGFKTEINDDFQYLKEKW